MRQNNSGKVTFIATDSRGVTKAIAALIAQHYSDKRLLVINSETSGGEAERDFLKAPDLALMGADGADYDVIIASPSMATGISIEALGVITKVFGVLMGGSASDRDMPKPWGESANLLSELSGMPKSAPIIPLSVALSVQR